MQITKQSNNELNGYLIGKTIGRGTFGKVKKAIHKLSNQPVAIKFLEKDKIKDITDVQRVSRQLHILKIVRHPAIAQLYEIIQNPKMIYIVMQYATNGQYFDFVMDGKVKNQQEAFHYFSQIVSALIYLHKLKITHRDVKPQNILLDTMNKIKIVDFGLSNMYRQGEKLSTACGSPCYASPQMIKGQDYDPQLTDIWSLGIVLYTSVMANLPFQDDNTNALYNKIKSGVYVLDKSISIELRDLLIKMINVRPQNRLRLEQITEHSWYRKYNNHKQIYGIQVGYENIPIDKQIVKQMQSLGFQNKKTIKYLENNIKNHCTATYYLLLKRNFKHGKPSNMDICSDHFDKINLKSEFKIKSRRYKSFDLGKYQQRQENKTVIEPVFKKQVMMTKTKHRYASMNNFQESYSVEKKDSLISTQLKSKSSFYNFLKNKEGSQVKWKIVKNSFTRNRSISLSNQNKHTSSKKQNDFILQLQKPIRKQKSVCVSQQYDPKKIIKTENIYQVYGPSSKSKDKRQKSFKKSVEKNEKRQKTKDKPKLFVNSNSTEFQQIFWKKKSIKTKNVTTGVKKANQIYKNVRLNYHI